MRDIYWFIVGRRLAILGGARLGFLTIAGGGICMLSPGGAVIQISLLAITTWGLSGTRILPYSCCCPSRDSWSGGASACCSSSGSHSVLGVVANG